MSTDISDCITYTFIWHALGTACKQCSALNGRIWENQDVFQSTLWDMFYGNIWDLNANQPLTHGGTGIHCCCQLEVQAHCDWSKIKELNQLSEVLNMHAEAMGEMGFSNVKTGSYRSATFGDSGGHY
ncbi:MAG: hypothetical protein ABSD42_05815 [Candidatus Bathyarchaeia archaeon]|jgi:hypothetical protein